MHCILSSSTGGKEGALHDVEEGDGSGIHWGHHLPTGTSKGQSRHIWQRAAAWAVGTKGKQLCMKYHTQNPLKEKPSNKII